MKKKIKTLILSMSLIPGLFVVDINQETIPKVQYINKSSSFTQSFIAGKNNLYEIRFYLNKPHLEVETPMFFTLREAAIDGKIVADTAFNAKNVGANYWLKMSFPPIPNSKGKTYFANIEAPKLEGKEIEIGYSDKKVLKDGAAYMNGEKIPGDLAFRTIYKQSPKEFFLNSTQDTFSRLTKDTPFFIFYSLLLTSTALCFLYQTKKPDSEETPQAPQRQ